MKSKWSDMQKIKVLIFDLDDTLYDELSFVKSGFLAVAKFLNQKKGLETDTIFKEMIEILDRDGRGFVFDTLLKNHKIYQKKLVNACLKCYRHHEPKLELNADAKRALKRFNQLPIYILTDGHKIVQLNKIKSLKLESLVKDFYITNRYGIGNNKPSPYCFWLICKRENVLPSEVVYIADNPYKDFIGLKKDQFQTIRLLNGRYKDIRLDELHEADMIINSLDELKV